MPDALLRFDRDDCLPIERALTREWLLTDGIGGYASSSILLCHARRHHGLLAAIPAGHATRHLFLARFDESLHREQTSFSISLARYRGAFSTGGQTSLQSFELLPFASFSYRIGRANILRQVLLVQGAPIVLSRYLVETGRRDIELRLRPLLPFRRADGLTGENLELDPRVARIARGIGCRPYASLPALHVTVGGADARFDPDPVWYRRIEYPTDLRRGEPGHEDQFSPGTFRLHVTPDEAIVVAATIDSPVDDPAALWQTESARQIASIQTVHQSTRDVLQFSSTAFVARAPLSNRLTVQAGFPWLGEWGRDTFVAAPGLLLRRDDPAGVDACGEILAGALTFLRDGLLPDRFGRGPDDSGYGSIDTSLWFARAVRLWSLAGGSRDELHERFLPALRAIADGLAAGGGAAGRALGLVHDDGGLLSAGAPDVAPTWMQSRDDDGPVTPRHGCAVEVNALWAFLLKFLETLHGEHGDAAGEREWRRRRRRAAQAFLQRFWIDDERYLADVWRAGQQDRSLRPNMVIAAALEWSPLTRGKRTDVVRHAEAELLTPRGLRSLDPADPRYLGRHEGPPADRERALHRGTVWPWLCGFYCEASLRAYGAGRKHVRGLRALLDGFADHLREHGLLHVSQVFDGDPPHRPGGTIAQAWSCGELLRAYRMLDGGTP
jgi:predicted glycogen debranching enzyme